MRNFLKTLTIIFVAICISSCNTTDSQETLDKGFKNLLDSVVKIDVWSVSQKDGGSTTSHSIGSGVIISDNGIIATNAHVVNADTKKIIITLSNLERVNAKFIGWDHWTDLAIIQLDKENLKARNIEFSSAKFGDSDKLIPAEIVYAVGTPHGFERTVTRGIISNTKRYFEGSILSKGFETGSFNTWIQTDAAINPGNSGGPLVKTNGDIIGINTRAYSKSNNLGFAVPSNVAKSVIKQLIENGKVARAYIGVNLAPLQDLEDSISSNNKGVLIQNVDVLSPAAKADIKTGDIITAINNENIDGRFPEQLPAIMNKIAQIKVGTDINLKIKQGENIIDKTIKTELLESRVGNEYSLEKWGVLMRDITKAFARESKIKIDSKLIVVGVRNGYAFEKADIKRGDIIVSINRKKIKTQEDLRKAYEQYLKEPKKMLIEVMRDFKVSYHIIEE